MKELCLRHMQNIHQVTHAEAISFNCVGKERDGNMDLTKVFLKYWEDMDLCQSTRCLTVKWQGDWQEKVKAAVLRLKKSTDNGNIFV